MMEAHLLHHGGVSARRGAEAAGSCVATASRRMRCGRLRGMGEALRRTGVGENVSTLILGSSLDCDGVSGFVGVRFACVDGSLASARVGP